MFFSQYTKGIIVLDQDGQLLIANRLAKNLIAKSNSIEIDDDQVVFNDKNLEKLFESALDVSQPDANSTTFFWADIEFEYPLRIDVLPVNGNNRISSHDCADVIISIDTAGLKVHRIHQQFQSYYRLTKTEVDLVERLLKGLTLRQYAVERKVTVSTARWTLGNIFTKVSVNSQRELIVLATHFADQKIFLSAEKYN